jgi:NADPH2:quinone reductase
VVVRAVVVTRSGGPEVLELRNEPEPAAGAGQVVVDVEAIGVNFRDIYERRGDYGGTPPFVAGVEGAGTVASVGEDVADLEVGQRVAWVNAPGSYAERVAVEAARAVPVPEGISAELAASALLQGMTAQYLATDSYAVQPGDTVLVHAAAGGAGSLLTQVVKLLGGRVIATTSTDEKAELARRAGADTVLGYDGFAERVRELTDGEGVPAVFDGVGKATFDESLESLRPRGILVLFGSASGHVPPFDPMRLAARSLFLTRPSLHHYTATREELRARAAQVFEWLGSGELQVGVGGRYPLEQARQAQEDLESRRTTGKLLLLP